MDPSPVPNALLVCRRCGQPVLGAIIRVDQNGHPLHERCYLDELLESIEEKKDDAACIGFNKGGFSMSLSQVTPLLRCRLCNHPLLFEPSRIDGRGQPVHEECYVRELISEPYPEERAA